MFTETHMNMKSGMKIMHGKNADRYHKYLPKSVQSINYSDIFQGNFQNESQKSFCWLFNRSAAIERQQINFSENFAYVVNEWPLKTLSNILDDCAFLQKQLPTESRWLFWQKRSVINVCQGFLCTPLVIVIKDWWGD